MWLNLCPERTLQGRNRLGQPMALSASLSWPKPQFHMTTARKLTSFSLMCLAVASSATAAGSEENSASFDYKPVSKWEYVVPGESWVEITDEISIPHGDEGGFRAKVYGPEGAEKLDIDTNGDGRLDQTCKGMKGSAKLKGKDADGNSFTYAIRLRHTGKKWFYASGGVMKGKVNGNMVSIIDANSNGRWNDYSVDCYVDGKGEAATPITEALSLGGELYSVELQADGQAASWSAFEGETGNLDMTKEYEGNGSLTSALVESTDGRFQFNLADCKKGLKVPAGSYVLKSAAIKKRSLSAQIEKGDMKPFEVPAAGAYALEWGGPVTAVYDWKFDNGKITVSPNALRFLGKAGEEYKGFSPSDVGPKILVTDERTKKQIASGRFKLC